MQKVDQHHLDTMILFSVRYALGRRSTAPMLVSDLVKVYGAGLSTQLLGQLAEELQEELYRAVMLGTTVGDQCDHDVWVDLRHWVRAVLAARQFNKHS